MTTPRYIDGPFNILIGSPLQDCSSVGTDRVVLNAAKRHSGSAATAELETMPASSRNQATINNLLVSLTTAEVWISGRKEMNWIMPCSVAQLFTLEQE